MLQDERLTVTGEEQPFAVRWHDGPALFVSVQRGSYIEPIIRGLVSRRRKHRTLIPGCDTQVKIELSNVEEVLDEINTLIEVQCALHPRPGACSTRAGTTTLRDRMTERCSPGQAT